MKDISVSPAGLFSPDRQRVLLDALIARFRTCQSERHELIHQHASQRADEEQQLLSDRSGVTADCRRQRFVALSEWDAAEETVFSSYEENTLRLRHEINRLATLYRRKLAEGKTALERKVEARRAAVQHQYDSRKHEPGEKSKKEIERINAALIPITKDMEWACELTVRRLDGLPNVPQPTSAEEDMSVEPPETIKQSIDSIEMLSRRCKEFIAELQSGASAKFGDSFYLPVGVALTVPAWIIGVLVARPEAFWIFMGSGLAVIGAIAVGLFASVIIPLRRKTRKLYPLIYRTAKAAENVAAEGRKISNETARQSSQELIRRRDEHFEAAEHWRQEQLDHLVQSLSAEEDEARTKLAEQLNQLGDKFQGEYSALNAEMHHRAEAVAAAITSQLASTDNELHSKRESNARRRHAELQRVTHRMRDGVRVGLDRITLTNQTCLQRFPTWDEVAVADQTDKPNLSFVPIGRLIVGDMLYRTIASEQAAPESGPVGNATSLQESTEENLEPMFQQAEIPKV